MYVCVLTQVKLISKNWKTKLLRFITAPLTNPFMMLNSRYVITAVTLILFYVVDSSLAGCGPDAERLGRGEGADAGYLCCPGRNNTCLAGGSRLNNLRAATCFCDESCIVNGDCCTDYANACPVRDCRLAEDWGEWGECSASCGPGIKHRHREVIVHPANGGRPCEVSTQKMHCEGEKCKVARAHQGFDLLKERARIVPAQFGSWRVDKKYNPYQDIRKNLFEHYANDKSLDRPSYCAEFEVVDVHSSCQTSKASSWSARLKRGASLCVECQPFSMKAELGGRCSGHGVFQKATYWKAMTVPGCHGKWVMKKQHQDGCQCDPNMDNSFVLI